LHSSDALTSSKIIDQDEKKRSISTIDSLFNDSESAKDVSQSFSDSLSGSDENGPWNEPFFSALEGLIV